MAYTIGIVLGILVGLFLRTTGFDRDRAVYPTILIVIPGYYVLFAAMAGSTSAIMIECAVMISFALVAVRGFASNLWWIAGALAAGRCGFPYLEARLEYVRHATIYSKRLLDQRCVSSAHERTRQREAAQCGCNRFSTREA